MRASAPCSDSMRPNPAEGGHAPIAVARPVAYTVTEEILHTVTHGVGLVLSLAGFVVLVTLAAARGGAFHVVGCAIYGATLVVLYASSTLYHALPWSRAKHALRLLDGLAIYLLIAGTYTPFTLVTLRGGWGWTMFGLVWTLALFGMVVEIATRRRIRGLSPVLYVLLGWLAVVAIDPILAAVPPLGIALIVLGGLAYMGGLVFYAWERLAYHHAVWHVFVLAGSAFHFLAVLYTVIPWEA